MSETQQSGETGKGPLSGEPCRPTWGFGAYDDDAHCGTTDTCPMTWTYASFSGTEQELQLQGVVTHTGRLRCVGSSKRGRDSAEILRDDSSPMGHRTWDHRPSSERLHGKVSRDKASRR